MMNRVLYLLFFVSLTFLHAITPKANYQMDECAWGGVAGEVKDSSGNSYNGTAYSLSTESNITFGGVLCRVGDFTKSGTDDYISFDKNAMYGLGDFSLSVWIKTDETDKFTIISAANSREDNEATAYFTSADEFRPYIKGNGTTLDLPISLNDNKWHHLVWTRDGVKNCAVIDGNTTGKVCGNINNTDKLQVDDNGLLAGQDQDSVGGDFDADQAFEGYLDELKIFDVVLSDDEIEEIYDNEKARKNFDGTTRDCQWCVKPVANYRLDECAWSGVNAEVKDSSGNEFNLKSYNGANTESNISLGGGICHVGKFDGFDDKVEGNFDYEFKNSLTFTVWIDTTQTQDAYARLVEFASHGGDYHYSTALAYDSAGKIIRGWTTNSSKQRSKEVSYDLASKGYHDGKWHFIAYTYDGEKAKLYVDNNLVDQEDTNITQIETPNKITIAGYGLSTDYTYQGYIDEVKVYDKALDANTLSNIYNNEKNSKNFDGSQRVCSCYEPYANYRMDACFWDGSSDEVKDSSTNGYDGVSHEENTDANGSVGTILCRYGDFTKTGTKDYLSLDNNALNGLGDFSLAVWINTSQSDTFSVFSAANSSEDNEAVMWFGDSTTFRPYIKGSYTSLSIPDVGDGKWHHAVWTRDTQSGENCIVIDGDTGNKKCDIINKTGDIQVDVGGLIVGQEQDSVGGGFSSSQAYDGYMDELKVFNHVISDEQIQSIYSREKNGKNFDGSDRVCPCCLVYDGDTVPLEFEGAHIVLNDSTNAPHWTHVDFNTTFSSTPAVFVVASTRGDHPATVRVKNVSTSGFDAVMSEPQGEDGPHYDQNISYLAVNKGIHKIGNTYFQVGSISTKKYQQASHGENDVNQWEKIDTIFTSCQPVVVANIQTINNETGLDIPNSDKIIRSIPFLTTAIDVNSSGVFLALERSETHEGDINNDETIAYMVAPANIQDSVVDDYGNNIIFETIRKRDYFVGWDDSCKSVDFVNNYSTIPLIAANKNSKNGADGGWFRRCVLDNEKVGFVIDEDGSSYSKTQYDYNSTYQDTERHHVEETGGIFVFSNTIVIREENNESKNYKFDVWDTFRDINDRNISTKIVSQGFDLTLASLDENNENYQEFNGTVCVVSDNNISKVLFLDQNSSTLSLQVSRAIKDLRIHISWKKNVDENCPLAQEDNSTDSSDNFAVRPKKFYIDINSTKFYAGVPFHIDINATDFADVSTKDYNETRGISFVFDINDSNATCSSGILGGVSNPFSFVDGTVSFDANYSDVGDVNFTLREINGSEFAKVDEDDTNDTTRLIKEYSKKIRVEPYQFAIVDYEFVRNPDQDWRYMGDVNDSNISISFMVQAQNRSGDPTKKFDAQCYSQDVGVSIDLNSTSSDGNVSYYQLINGVSKTASDRNLSDFDLIDTVNAQDFSDANSSRIKYALNVYRKYDSPVNPLDITALDINTTYPIDANVLNIGLSLDDNKSRFYYGRVRTSDIDTNKQSVKHSLDIEIYSDTSLSGFRRNSLSWYGMNRDNITKIIDFLPKKDFSMSDDKAGINDINSTQNISDGVVSFTITNSWSEADSAYIHLKIPNYLWYSRYNDYSDSNSSNCGSHPCFKYNYLLDGSSANITSGNFNGTDIGSDYNASKVSKKGVKVFR